MQQLKFTLLAITLACGLTACGAKDGDEEKAKSDDSARVTINPDPYPSTYKPYPSSPTLIRGATVLDGIGGMIEGGDVLIVDGKVSEVGESLNAPDRTIVVDGTGKWVTPGIIDIHSIWAFTHHPVSVRCLMEMKCLLRLQPKSGLSTRYGLRTQASRVPWQVV